jgi:hypothetical protein
LDARTGRSRVLIKDVRAGDFAFNRTDKSLWGVRHFNGISTIVRIPYPYDDWNQIYSFDYGKDIFDIDISPDGTRLTGALAEVSGRQTLITMTIDSLLKGNHLFDILYDFENSTPAGFVFSRNGRFLFGSSYYSGVSNIVRYDFRMKKMEWVTNCESGLFRPLPISDDSLIAFLYTGRGFVPVMIANQTVEDVSAIKYLGQEVVETHPIVKTWVLSPPSLSLIDNDSTTSRSGEYSPMRNIKLASVYPMVEGYKKFPAYGVRMNFSDPTQLHSMNLTASYTPNQILPPKERLHFDFNYAFWQWKISGTYNGGDFYDLFGPTRTSRKGYSARLQYREYLLFEEPESMDYRLTLATYGDLERLPDYQNIAASFDRFTSFDARLSYSLLTRSLGAVEEEEGVQWELASHNNFANDKLYPLVFNNFDYGVLLPINHSSLWLRSSLGYSFGDRAEPFANFFFGGFGNNWVDHREVWRYREDYSFPGVELNSIGGKTYGKAMVEWTLPPIRFRRFGVPALYCNWTRIALFSTAIVTNFDSKADRRSLLNVGGQIDFRLVIFSALESTFSLGYAGAIERDQRLDKEFMISLKVLK